MDTVSYTHLDVYKRQLLDPWFAYGLDRFLRERKWKLSGILNGIDKVRYEYGLQVAASNGKESQWGNADASAEVTKPTVNEIEAEIVEEEKPDPAEQARLAREAFFEVFWEIDEASMDAYVAEHPDVIANGWDSIHINAVSYTHLHQTEHQNNGQKKCYEFFHSILLYFLPPDGGKITKAVPHIRLSYYYTCLLYTSRCV